MNEKFYALSEEKQSQILNAAYKVFATNQYKKATTSEIVAEAGISKSLLFHYFHNKRELYLFLWNYAADLTRKYTFLSLFSINSYFETEPDIQSIIQPDVQDVAKKTLEMLLSIMNLDLIRKDLEVVAAEVKHWHGAAYGKRKKIQQIRTMSLSIRK